MEIADVLANGGLVISGAALARIADIAMKAWSTRNQRTEISPNPLKVQGVEAPTTSRLCDERHKDLADKNVNLFARVGSVEQRLSTVEATVLSTKENLSYMDRKLDRILDIVLKHK